MKFAHFAIAALLALWPMAKATPANMNFSNARQVVLNECPHIELSGFTGENYYDDRRRDFRYKMSLTWSNKSDKPITAFEVNVAKYDPFNRHVSTRRWTITGHNSADWSPLPPNVASTDGTIGFSTEDHLTTFAYVTAIRFDDNTVWRYDMNKVAAKIRAELPGLKEIGNLDGEKPAPAEKK